MKKIGLRSLSVFLAVLMILFAFPLQVIAAELQNQTPVGDTAASGEAVTSTPIPGVDYEVTALREENVKHFHLTDGSYVAVSYDVPVHYADESGDWQDIDNRLADSGSDFTTRDARVKFAKKITGNGELFTIHDGNRRLSFSLVGALKKTVGTVEDNGDSDTGADTVQKWMELKHLSSSIIYRDILPGTDVEYLLDAGRMKENIIVREAAAEYRYVFELTLNHLSARSNEDGSISVTDPESGETVYYLPAPVVYDAAGAYSYDAVSYTLSEGKDNKLTLTLEADPAWVNAPERVFPVTVDPTINGAYSEFSDTYISEKPPKSVHGVADTLRTGITSSGGTHIIYWKQNQLPTLPKGAQVTDAKLSLYFKDSDGPINISDTELALGIYRVSEDWTESLNWNAYSDQNMGKIAELQDFTVIDSLSSVGSYINWTISDLVRSWYGGTSNYGVAIKPIGGTARNLDFASSDAPGNRPRFAIQYKVVNGLEDYWSYSSHGAANAGTGHVNLATGELSFVFPTVSSGENLFGYQLGLVYNQSKINGADAPIANTLTDYRLTCQETVTAYTYLSESGTETTAYIWTDGDGTAHYLLPGGDGKYLDEDGLGLTLQKQSDSTFLLTDKNNTKRYFNTSGYLDRMRDKIGNRVVFTYTTVNGYKSVSGINIYPAGSSKAISTLSLTYESSGVLKTVKNEKTSETVTFEYDGAGGTSITLDQATYSRQVSGNPTPYTRSYTVEYELGRRIKTVYDAQAEYGLSYTYDTAGRVSKVTEVGGVKKAPGQSVGYTYGSGYTEIRTAGKDDKYGTTDDLISHYTFDNQLRCVSQYTTNADRNMIYGATRGRYEDASENRALENKLSESFVTGNTGLNYLLNGSFELGSLNYWDTYCVTLSEFPDTGYFGGEYCAQVTVSNSAYLLQYVQLSKGTYTLSFNIESALPESNPDGVTIEASYPARNGENQRVSVTKKFPEDNYYTVSFTVDTDTNGMIGLFFSKSGTDSAVFHVDNVVLEKNLGSSGNNLVSCGDFAVHTTKKHGSSGWTLGDFWCEADLPDFALGYNDFNRDDPAFPNVLVIEGEAGLRGEFVQTIVSNDTGSARYKGCKLLVSGFGKADHISANENSRFGLKMTVNYVANSDGTVPTPAEYYVPFDRGTSDWQFVSDVFTVPEEDGIQSITVSVVYDYQIGTAMFTDISVQLYSENPNYIYAEQYKYNNNGDLIYKSDGTDEYWYFYKYVNGIPKLEKSVKNASDWLVYSYNDSDGTVKSVSSYYKFVAGVSYSYGEKPYSEIVGAVPSSFSDDNRRYIKEYTYNTTGQCTSEKTSTSDGITKTSSTYVENTSSAAYGSVSTSTDERGKITRYYYDTATGNVSFTVAPDGTAKVYTYDGFGNLIGVKTAVYNMVELTETNLAPVNYKYNTEGLLDSVTTDTTKYTFSYNVFGQMEDISVGSTTLVDYILNDNNGKVSEMRYGNGASVRYVYDTLDRVSEVWYAESATADEVKMYTYAYDAAGRLVRYTDHTRNEQYTYLYTPTGLLHSTQISDLGEAYTYRTNQYRYDEKNRVVEKYSSFEFANHGSANGFYTFAYSYGYDPTDQYVSTISANALADKGYHATILRDDLMRLSGKTFVLRDLKTPENLVTNQVTYTYLDGANGSTTGLVKSYQTLINGSGTTYNLTYDHNGNITSVSRGNYLIVRYAYDDLGQMVREDNREKNYTYYYTYDKAGNILYKEAFSLMMNGEDLSDKTPVYTNVYTYGNANWGDLLTSYKGHTITYDAIGNPLTYYGRTAYTFTWKNGRQLATATANGKTLSFTYNDQGMRLTKTVDGVTHTYSLDGDRIVAEEWGNQLLVYFYDDDGLPMGMMYRNSSYADKQFDYYLYEKDVFGNIIAIYNASGTKVVSYCYDAWGNCTVLTNTNGIGTMNPFRYRGYYLDTETNLYYLQSRYYDAYTGRFINADDAGNLGIGDELLSYNLFSYCANNPVMGYDPTGTFNWGKLAAIVCVAAVITASVVLTVATFGAGSVAGTIAISSAITIAAKTTEVAALQIKKSKQDGDSAQDIVGDVIDSIFDNGASEIGLLPITKTAGYLSGFFNQSMPFQDTLELMKLDGFNARNFMSSAGGEMLYRLKNPMEFLSMSASTYSSILSYGFAAYNVGNAIYSCFTNDPVKRAKQRNYTLR